jgi:tetratricopeptide (TPR) repeat protein
MTSRKSRRREGRAAAAPRSTARTAAVVFEGRRLWVAVALALAVGIAYAPALRAPFIFDDGASITDNSSIRRLWPPSIPLHPPGGGRAVSGRPVVNYSLAVDYWLNSVLGTGQAPGSGNGTEVISYHVTNVLLHLLCGVLLFGVIRRTLRSPPLAAEWANASIRVAGVTSAIWLLHPIQSEAVNYVMQRTELIVSACWLATLYSSIRAWDAASARARLIWLGVAVCACALGMGSKEVMIGAPIVVLLYDRVFRVESWRELAGSRQRVLFYALLFSTSGLLMWSVASGARADSVGLNLGMTWYSYLYSQAWAIGHYVRLVFWPYPLTIDYGAKPISGYAPLPGIVFVAACGVATFWAWLRPQRWGWCAFAGAWFFILLAPSSSFVPIVSEIAAERRIYLALAAVVLVLVVACETTLRKLAAGSARQKGLASRVTRHAALVVTALCMLLAGLTFRRSEAYASPETLWRSNVHAWPRNPRGYTNLGQLLSEEPKRFAEAESLFTRAIELDSSMTLAWIDLAYVKTKEGRLSDAEVELRRAMDINDPANHEIVVERYGRTLLGMGDLPRAIPLLERAAADNVTDQNYFWLGVGYLDAGRSDDAVAALRKCLSLNPDFAIALRYLGRALIEGGDAADAVQYLQAAVVRDPGSPVNLSLLSLAFATMGRPEDAVQAATASARIGGDAEGYVFAGRAMMQLHKPREAKEYFALAIQLHPDDWESLTRLGLADAELGDKTAAATAFRQALSVQPTYAPAREALAQLLGRP